MLVRFPYLSNRERDSLINESIQSKLLFKGYAFEGGK